MLKLIRRSFASLIAGASISPVAARPVQPESAQVMTDLDAALREIKYEHQVGVRPDYLQNYKGEKTTLNESLIALNAKGEGSLMALPGTLLNDEQARMLEDSKRRIGARLQGSRWTNSGVTARQEMEEFVGARTK